MELTFGQLAGLIAAVAFLLLVVFLCIVLVKAGKIMNEVKESIKAIRFDVNGLSKEAESILAKSNSLLTDIEGKAKTIDPLFQAVADLSESVSDLNNASRGLATKVTSSTKNTGKASLVFGAAKKLYNLKNKNK